MSRRTLNAVLALLAIVVILAVVVGAFSFLGGSLENSPFGVETAADLDKNTITYSWSYDPDEDVTYFGFTGKYDPRELYKIDYDIPYELNEYINISPKFLRGPMSDYKELTSDYIISVGTDLNGKPLRSGSVKVMIGISGTISFFFGYVDGNITGDTMLCNDIIGKILNSEYQYKVSKLTGYVEI